MGNCGVGLAPCRPQAHDIAALDLVNVEAIPYDVLKRGITWDWESFPSYLQAAGRRGSAINLGFLAPLTPFRHYVMGEESMERAATRMKPKKSRALLREAVAAGALGLSLTTGIQHVGYKGRPLACRLADRAELGAYAHVLRDLGKGVIEVTLTQNFGHIQDHELDLLKFLLDESGRRVTWLAIFDLEDQPRRQHRNPAALRGADQARRSSADDLPPADRRNRIQVGDGFFIDAIVAAGGGPAAREAQATLRRS